PAQVAAARDRLPDVGLPDDALRQICAVCGAFGVDGMRADLVTARTAIALAAWNGRDTVTEADIRTAARLALPHRRRRDPFDAPGRRSAARGPFGRTVGARLPQDHPFSLHLPATVRAAALRGRHAPAPPVAQPAAARRVTMAPVDLREAVREGREGNLVLFVVDASGSMAARQRMRAVKGAVLSLLLDAYQRRDKVGLVTFRGTGAEVALPPTSSVEAAARRLTSLATGGRTPLAAGLIQAARVLATERIRDPRRRALLVVVTDGRATSGSDADLARAAALLTGPGLNGTGPGH